MSRAGPGGGESPRPRYRIRPPEALGKHDMVFVVLDSCRFDAFARADLRFIPRIGGIERRWSYASWTAPSHYNLLMGLLPHPSPQQVYASDHYKADFRKYDERLGAKGVDFDQLLPSFFLPTFLRRKLGYYTHARVSMPIINPETPLNRDFDTFELMDRHNDFGAMIDELHFSDQRPSFYLLNVGETHFPYATAEEPTDSWPKIHGENGVFEPINGRSVGGKLLHEHATDVRFRQSELDRLQLRQVRALEEVDRLFEKLLDKVPTGTWVVVTADHGELFGEDGYFGHGPILHDKVLEVPFVEGRV